MNDLQQLDELIKSALVLRRFAASGDFEDFCKADDWVAELRARRPSLVTRYEDELRAKHPASGDAEGPR